MSKPSFTFSASIASALLLGSLAAGCGGVGTAQADLRSAIDAQQASMNECYREALTRDEALSGDVSVRISMARKTTTVSSVEVLESAVSDETLNACVEEIISGISIDEAPGANMSVDYTLRYTPSSSN